MADSAALTAILEELLLAADTRTPVPQDPVDLGGLVVAAVGSAQAAATEAGLSLDAQLRPPATPRWPPERRQPSAAPSPP